MTALSLADLRVAVDEYTRYVQDVGQDLGLAEGFAERNATLRALRAELAQRVAAIVLEVAA